MSLNFIYSKCSKYIFPQTLCLDTWTCVDDAGNCIDESDGSGDESGPDDALAICHEGTVGFYLSWHCVTTFCVITCYN